jgi:hypothetical protein
MLRDKDFVLRLLLNTQLAFFPMALSFATGLAMAHQDTLWTFIYGVLALGSLVLGSYYLKD